MHIAIAVMPASAPRMLVNVANSAASTSGTDRNKETNGYLRKEGNAFTNTIATLSAARQVKSKGRCLDRFIGFWSDVVNDHLVAEVIQASRIAMRLRVHRIVMPQFVPESDMRYFQNSEPNFRVQKPATFQTIENM